MDPGFSRHDRVFTGHPLDRKHGAIIHAESDRGSCHPDLGHLDLHWHFAYTISFALYIPTPGPLGPLGPLGLGDADSVSENPRFHERMFLKRILVVLPQA